MTLNKPLIIQLLGQARAGKDFTAVELAKCFKKLGLTTEIKSYAAPMKRIAAALFDITLEELDAYKNSPEIFALSITDRYEGTTECSLDLRVFLQRLGNDAIKPEFGDSVWANLMVQEVSKSTADIIIITDCRFYTEFNTFPNAITIRVINESLPPPMKHASELELLNEPVNYTLVNTSYSLTSKEICELVNLILKDYKCNF